MAIKQLTANSLFIDKEFVSLDESDRVSIASDFFNQNISSDPDFGKLSKDEQGTIIDDFFKHPALGPIDASKPPTSPIGKALDIGTKPLQVLFEGFDREEAAFAEPFIRTQLQTGNAAEGFVDGMMGRSVSPIDPSRDAQLGDILRLMDAPEPIAAVGGLAMSLLLPSSLAIEGLVGRLLARGRKLKGIRQTRFKQQAGNKVAQLRALERVSPLLDDSLPLRALEELDKTGLFPDITKRYANEVDELLKREARRRVKGAFPKGAFKKKLGGRLPKEFFELLVKDAQTKLKFQVEKGAKSGVTAPFSALPRLKGAPKKPLDLVALRNKARENVMKSVIRDFAPQSKKQLLKNLANNANGSVTAFGKIGETSPMLRKLDQLDDIIKGKKLGTPEDIGFMRQLIGGINIPSQVMDKNPFSRALFAAGRFTEQQIIKRTSQRFHQVLADVSATTGIRAGSLEAKQLGFLSDSFSELRQIPRDGSLKDLLVKIHTNEKTGFGASEDVVRGVVDEFFPTADVSDEVVNAFDLARNNISNQIARLAGLKPNQTIAAYYTRVYKDLSKMKIRNESGGLALLDNMADDLNIDPAMHELIKRKAGFVSAAATLRKGVLPKEKFFGSFKARKKGVPTEVKDQLFQARDWDYFNVTSKYIDGVSTKLGMDAFLPRAQGLLDDMARTGGTRISEFSHAWTKAFMGMPVGGAFNRSLRQVAAWEANRQFISKIGLRPITAMINLTQTPLNTLTRLANENGFVGGGKIFMQSLAEYFTARGQKMISGSGVLQESVGILEDFSSNRKIMRKVADVTGLLFKKVEDFNRGFAFLAGRRSFKSTAKKASNYVAGRANLDAANQFGREFVDLTNFIFDKSNRPLGLQTPIGSIIGRFKLFTINQIDFFARELTKPRGVLMFAGMVNALGGPDAIPGVEGLRQQMNDRHPDHILTRTLNDMQRFSVAGQLGIDLSGGRLGIPGFQEIKLFSGPGARDKFEKGLAALLGPTVSDMNNFFNTINDMQHAKISPQTIRNIVKLASVQGADILELVEIAKTGELTDSQNRPILKIPKEDAIKFALGFQTPEIAQSRLRTQRRSEVDKERNNMSLTWANLIRRGKTVEASELLLKAHEKGLTLNITTAKIRDIAMAGAQSSDVRSFRGASLAARQQVPLARPDLD